jgi:threonine synthase
MRFRSTRGASPDVDLVTAILEGVAADDGLYLPNHIAPLAGAAVRGHRDATLHEIAAAVLAPFCEGAVARDTFEAIVRQTFTFPIPLVQLDEQTHVLELFHGPTLAFKDVGARFLARMLSAVRSPDAPLVVLTATSGDTGGAVANALHDIAGIEATVLFPKGRVSALQERQITTVGGSVRAVAVEGSFDDCQRLVKAAFADQELRRSVTLTSANSINIGRLLPQIVYYFAAVAQMSLRHRRLVMSVPSGNLGNLTAGLLAKRCGLPVDRFIAATNANTAFGTYLDTGTYAPRQSIPTVSSAMDVGSPNNLERIVSLYDGDRRKLAADVEVHAVSDAATKVGMAEVFTRYGYVVDPHTAVGMCGLREVVRDDPQVGGIVLATAHPAKFPEIVASVLGQAVAVPDRLADLDARPAASVTIPARVAPLRSLLLDAGPR